MINNSDTPEIRRLTPSFQYALDQLEHTDKHLFITGKAGTGKSTFIQMFRDSTEKKIVVLAPTGIAALNVRGQTIHSFFRFPPRLLAPEDIRSVRIGKLLAKTDIILIDEISMVRADLLDAVDASLQKNLRNKLPFGGKRLVMVGDPFQLPPVVASKSEREYIAELYKSPWFFDAWSFKQLKPFEVIDFPDVFRQVDPYFIRLLDDIRLNRIDWDDLEALNERHIADKEEQTNSVTLCTINATADRINRTEMDKLPDKGSFYAAEIKGQFPMKQYPTEYNMLLKKGAQIIFLRNDPEKRFVNGSIGKITGLSKELIHATVMINGEEQEIEVKPMEWEIIRYKPGLKADQFETETIGSFIQFPLKPAWAITIHKSQGQSFDNVHIDLGKRAFEYGQTYVALSRCRTLAGLTLSRPLRPEDVMVDERIVDFMRVHE